MNLLLKNGDAVGRFCYEVRIRGSIRTRFKYGHYRKSVLNGKCLLFAGDGQGSLLKGSSLSTLVGVCGTQ